MKQGKTKALDFIVDKLTNSIENVVTGDSFTTNIALASNRDLINVSKKNDWLFNWKYELKQPEREVYKLTIVNNPHIIQGLISLEMRANHVYMHLVEALDLIKGKRKFTPGCRAI